MISRISAWLTAARRQAIQAAVATIVVALQGLGLITSPQGDAVTNLAAGILSTAVALLALANLDGSQKATWLATQLRATLYTLAGGVGVALVAFSIASDAQVTQVLAVISAALTVAQALVAVVNAPITVAATTQE
ncbi:hypothetical protein GCM10009785_26610 [Brooklawnia cerclae]|uniref:Holin n=1 Tax=Brooklawnia cerclae TaxID=349934 RepID=A0ABX0SJW8_9ACTN|nr:hypothetical protein [Brooklawnia cerclae]NIH57330.1 hypothetical protein [Brooklawnia cerclae]